MQMHRGDSLLPIEGIAADEFADDAGGGNFIVHVGFADVIENADDGTNLVVAAVLWHDLGEQWENVLLQNGQLI